MQFTWKIDQADIDRVKEILEEHGANPFVQGRMKRNLAATKPAVDRSEFWKQMVSMRMTSVQRSGPNSAVATYLRRGIVAQIAWWDSLRESSMITGRHEQLGPYEVQDHELVGLQ